MSELGEKVYEFVSARPGKKAADIARALGVEKRIVNGVLYGELKGKVVGKNYCWFLSSVEKRNDSITTPSNSLLSRICRYYLDCLSQDDLGGASVFASSYKDMDYFEIDEFPFVAEREINPFESPSGRDFLRRMARDQNRKAYYLGYPVRLRQAYSKKSGKPYFLVEPILLFPFESTEQRTEAPSLSGDLPILNFAALKGLAGGEDAGVMEEAIQLGEEIGLGNIGDARPDIDDLLCNLRENRSEWDWIEETDPYSIKGNAPLKDLQVPGIYNRAVVLVTEKSPYTQGLEQELGKLQKLGDTEYKGTALGAWLSQAIPVNVASNQKPLLEVVPLNEEQRQAVRKALSNSLTVITGPPGTGKSQIVTAMLINAAWQGMTALFASKNNKAVDVVETRVNALGPRPILLRLGANQFQDRLAEYLVSLLAAASSETDSSRHKEHLAIHDRLVEEVRQLEGEVESLIALRNEVDQNEQRVEDNRKQLGERLFAKARHWPSGNGFYQALSEFSVAINAADIEKQPFFTRLLWPFVSTSRYQSLAVKAGVVSKETSSNLDLTAPVEPPSRATFDGWRTYSQALQERVKKMEEVKSYFELLDNLVQSKPLNEYYVELGKSFANVAHNSGRLWEAWLRIQPSQMSKEERRLLGEYTAQLRMVIAARNQGTRAGSTIIRKMQELFPKVSRILSCWAVTSLSAKGRLPFIPGFFDLLIIDEASQCDIASALPLLYRAKRVVVIGDSKQLRHISKISEAQDAQLLEKHSLLDSYSRLGYATMSLFDLANATCGPEDIVALRDHHRSHAHIIDFSNSEYYQGRLRVATRYDLLKSPAPDKPAVRWINVKGSVVRPPSGGAVNESEAKAVVDEVSRLVEQSYRGTIGVVSPFRAQANRIQEIVAARPGLLDRLAGTDFLAETVHAFQGDERDVMFFSPVVAEGISKGATGFLNKTGNLFNVAVTRARAALIVVGDRAAILAGNVGYLTRFSEYVSNISSRATSHSSIDAQDLGPEYPKVVRPESVSDWERVLYREMYNAGIRAIPQYNVEKYMLDFAVIQADRRLNIEVDGERYHRNWDGELCRRDQIRNQRMIELGWDVKRFWVYQIRDDMNGCIASIRKWLETVA